MKSKHTIFFIAIIGLACSLFAQGPWAKKDWKQWSKEECKKVMEDSPWAYTYKEEQAQSSQGAGGLLSTSSGTRADATIETHYTVQFRSALPIRQAFVRQMLIDNKFDKSEEPVKQGLLKQTQPFLDRVYDDSIVVHVIYGSNVDQYVPEMMTYWQTHFPSGTVPQDAFLNTPSFKKIAPIKFISPRGSAPEFELIFPRMVDGKPVIGPNDKLVSVEFVTPSVGMSTRNYGFGRKCIFHLRRASWKTCLRRVQSR